MMPGRVAATGRLFARLPLGAQDSNPVRLFGSSRLMRVVALLVEALRALVGQGKTDSRRSRSRHATRQATVLA